MTTDYVPEWWLCPNGACEHGTFLHDIFDYEDRSPTCCVEGCTCGRAADEVDEAQP